MITALAGALLAGALTTLAPCSLTLLQQHRNLGW